MSILQSQIAPITSNSFPESLPAALRPIPHQIVSQIVEKATPEELTQVILAISQAQEQTSLDEISVQQLLPSTLVAKLPDELTPLLDTPINITPSFLDSFAAPAQLQYAVPLALIPEPTRTSIISKATPQELNEIISTLAKIEALPASQQAPVAGVPVASILPPSLQAKLPPSLTSPSVKLVPPVLLTLPTPAIDALLPVATPSEVSVLVANAAKLENMPSLVPRPPLGALLPPSLASKAPSNIVPLLTNPVQPIVPKPTIPKPNVPSLLNAFPAPLPKILLAKASPAEVETINSAIVVLQVAAPLFPITTPPRALNLLPHSILSKVPPQILPALTKPITLTPPMPSKEVTAISTVLAAIQPLVLKQIISVATPVELAEIKQKVISAAPATTPVISMLPVSLVSKLPPQVLPTLNKVVTIPAVAPVTSPTSVLPTIPGVSPEIVSAVTTALSKLPEPVLSKVLEVTTPDEISKIAEIISELKTAPLAEKSLISKLEIATILPPTLLEKLSPQILSELSVPVVISTDSSPEILPSIIVPGVPPKAIETISAALAAVPPPALTELLTEATPFEVETLLDTITKLEDLPPSEISLAEKVEVNAILPPSLYAKLPPSLVLLLAVPVSLPKAIPPPSVSGTPPTLLASITPALSGVPPPVISEIISLATPVELNELADTISKLEALPLETPLLKNVLIKNIIPETLVAKLPTSLVPLLNTPVTIVPPPDVSATTVAPPTVVSVISGVPSSLVESIVSALTTVPTPIVTKILSVATPSEITEVAETIKKLEELPPTDMAFAEKLEVETILPPSLVAKIPPTVLPLLRVPLTIQQVIPPLDATPATIPVGPGVPPTLVQTIAPALTAVPMPILSKIFAVATPVELAELAETIKALEKLPPTEAPFAEKLDVDTILPPSLIAKIPPNVLPLLSVPITISQDIPPSVPAPTNIPIVPGVPSTLVEAVVSALAAVPMPVVAKILSVATPTELAQLAETIKSLEELRPAEALLAEKLEVETILPTSLVAKIPPTVLPLLSVPIAIPKVVPPAPVTIPIIPGVPATVVETIVPALSAVPPEVVSDILSVATPAELTEVADIISKLETLTPTESIPVDLAVRTILPPTLVAKLPPAVLSVLSKPLTLSPADTVPVLAPASKVPVIPPPVVSIPGIPPSITSVAMPPLSSLPPPVITKILTTATASELSQLIDTILKLEALTPEEKVMASGLEVETVLPPSLVAKLPASMVPMLSKPVKIPGSIPVVSGVTPSPLGAPGVIPAPPVAPDVVLPDIINSIVPALSALPSPVISTLLNVATPPELAQLADAVKELEAVPPLQLPLLSGLPVETIIPESLLARLPPQVLPVIAKTPLKIAPPVPQAAPVTALPPVNTQTSEPIPPAEEKVLTKWAKVILEKTGRPAAVPIPGEIPPLQAAWMEWIQLKVNASNAEVAPETTESPSLQIVSSTEYPWTQWLKLKGNDTTTEPASPSPVPLLDVTTESPEKELLDWLETLEKTTESPAPSIAASPVSPEVEALVVETLKDLGIETVDLPPEQLKQLLAQVEKNIAVAAIPPSPAKDEISPPPLPSTSSSYPPPSWIPLSSVPQPSYPSPYYNPYMPYLQPKPFSPFWPPSSYLVPPSPLPPPPPAPSYPTASTVPTLNLTEYLVSNSMIPAETSPSASIPIPTLTKLLTDHDLASTISRNVTAEELSSLTPTKFAALLKQILQDCRDNSTINSTLATRSVYPNRYATYYKSKYSPAFRGKRSPSPALYPIPNQAFNPTTTPTTLSMDSLPLPKVETSGTVLDPAYWAAQKSMFLSKLFSTLAKVALNDSQAGDNQGTTQSPKQQLANQVNTVLLSDMTRSVHHRPPKKQKVVVEEDDSSEDPEYDYQGDQSSDDDDTQNNGVQSQSHDFNQNEKELVNNDDSEPDLPKEPENPLHKLFKFGIQKSILSVT